MKKGLIRLATFVVLAIGSMAVSAEPVTILSYDVTHAEPGPHLDFIDTSYTGAVVDNRHYTGGSGWLNDGKNDLYESYSFYLKDPLVIPTISLHLGDLLKIGYLDFTAVDIASLDITINGQTKHINAEQYGAVIRFNLEGSGLEMLETDTIFISNMTTSGRGFVAVSEIELESYSVGVVPEPAGLALLVSGIVGLGFIRRRKRSIQ